MISIILKALLRKILIRLRLDITKNLAYDRLTQEIIRHILKEDAVCVDVGCHKGEITDLILRKTFHGKVYAFEPVPSLFEGLKKKYAGDNRVYLYEKALSDNNSITSFHYVTSHPAYSGIKRRKYDYDNEKVRVIEVETVKLDDIIPSAERVDFMKIDVEGGEYLVLRGASRILTQYSPIILFEFGLGAAEVYGVTPATMYALLVEQHGYVIHTLEGFLKGRTGLSLHEFTRVYQAGEYYFIADKH